MNRIVPKIFSGGNRLVISETLCINPKEGLEIELPINHEKFLKISLIFEQEKAKESKYETTISGDSINIKFFNFLHCFGASLTKPIRFNLNKVNFLIRLYGFSNSENCLALTLSIYEEGGLVVR